MVYSCHNAIFCFVPPVAVLVAVKWETRFSVVGLNYSTDVQKFSLSEKATTICKQSRHQPALLEDIQLDAVTRLNRNWKWWFIYVGLSCSAILQLFSEASVPYCSRPCCRCIVCTYLRRKNLLQVLADE